jgi:hypothetical protein
MIFVGEVSLLLGCPCRRQPLRNLSRPYVSALQLSLRIVRRGRSEGARGGSGGDREGGATLAGRGRGAGGRATGPARFPGFPAPSGPRMRSLRFVHKLPGPPTLTREWAAISTDQEISAGKRNPVICLSVSRKTVNSDCDYRNSPCGQVPIWFIRNSRNQALLQLVPEGSLRRFGRAGN